MASSHITDDASDASMHGTQHVGSDTGSDHAPAVTMHAAALFSEGGRGVLRPHEHSTALASAEHARARAGGSAALEAANDGTQSIGSVTGGVSSPPHPRMPAPLRATRAGAPPLPAGAPPGPASADPHVFVHPAATGAPRPLMLRPASYVKIAALHHVRMGVNMVVRVCFVRITRWLTREDGSRFMIAVAVVGDETGIIDLKLQGDLAESMRSGMDLVVRNGFIRTRDGVAQMTVDNFGKVTPYPDGVLSTPSPPKGVNTSVDVSVLLGDAQTSFPLAGLAASRRRERNEYMNKYLRSIADAATVTRVGPANPMIE